MGFSVNGFFHLKMTVDFLTTDVVPKRSDKKIKGYSLS